MVFLEMYKESIHTLTKRVFFIDLESIYTRTKRGSFYKCIERVYIYIYSCTKRG